MFARQGFGHAASASCAEIRGCRAGTGRLMLRTQPRKAGAVNVVRASSSSGNKKSVAEAKKSAQRNLVMIGGRGCGKSSVCRRMLATDNRFKLMSLDDLIVYEANGQSIPEIVDERGWTGFRDLEFEVTTKAASFPEWSLIDAGGGVLVDLDADGNEMYSTRKAGALKKSGLVVYVKRDPAYLAGRIAGDSNRPDLSQTNSFKEIMDRREPWYIEAADLVIDATSKKVTKQMIAAEALTWFYDQIGEEINASKWYSVWDKR